MFEIALYQIKRACRYRTQLCVEILDVILNFLVQYFLWNVVLKEKSLYFTNVSSMILYYFMISTISILFRCNAADIADDFKNGRMDRELIRPIRLFEIKMAENVFGNLFLFFCTLPILLFLVFGIFGVKMKISLITFLLFIFSIILGYLIYYCIYFLVGLTALLIDEVWAIRGVVTFCVNMAAGYYLPLGMFPEPVMKVLEATPFYYIFYFPTTIIMEENGVVSKEVVTKLFVMVAWEAILMVVSKAVFQKLVKLYSAYGG